MGFPEVDQVRAQGALFGVFQGGQVTDGKLVERVVGIADGFFNGVEAAAVVFLLRAELRVHGAAFAIHQFRREQRG